MEMRSLAELHRIYQEHIDDLKLNKKKKNLSANASNFNMYNMTNRTQTYLKLVDN